MSVAMRCSCVIVMRDESCVLVVVCYVRSSPFRYAVLAMLLAFFWRAYGQH